MVSSSECAPEVDGPLSPGVAGKVVNVSRREPPERGLTRPGPTDIDQRFPRSHRLTSRQQFQQAYRHGSRVSCFGISLIGVTGATDHCRLGLTVPKKVGGAVVRNRVKRLVREAFRRNHAALVTRHCPVDLIVHARPGADELDYDRVERELLDGFRRLSQRLSQRPTKKLTRKSER